MTKENSSKKQNSNKNLNQKFQTIYMKATLKKITYE